MGLEFLIRLEGNWGGLDFEFLNLLGSSVKNVLLLVIGRKEWDLFQEDRTPSKISDFKVNRVLPIDNMG